MVESLFTHSSKLDSEVVSASCTLPAGVFHLLSKVSDPKKYSLLSFGPLDELETRLETLADEDGTSS